MPSSGLATARHWSMSINPPRTLPRTFDAITESWDGLSCRLELLCWQCSVPCCIAKEAWVKMDKRQWRCSSEPFRSIIRRDCCVWTRPQQTDCQFQATLFQVHHTGSEKHPTVPKVFCDDRWQCFASILPKRLLSATSQERQSITAPASCPEDDLTVSLWSPYRSKKRTIAKTSLNRGTIPRNMTTKTQLHLMPRV